MKDMKEIYLILTYTGTILSKAIKYVTKDEYAHISIALDRDLKYMYSFGRQNAYNPFIARFVHEGIEVGTFKRFKNTITSVYSLQITDEQYNKIKYVISKIENSTIPYTFNIKGILFGAFNMKYKKYHSYYCAEFIKHLLDSAKIENNLPEISKPEDFKSLDMTLTYKGKLQDYRKEILN